MLRKGTVGYRCRACQHQAQASRFMQDKIGQEFEGTVSGLTEWGMYVEIEPTKIEGMVSLREFTKDYLVFDEEKYFIVAKASGRKFTSETKSKCASSAQTWSRSYRL